MKAIVFEQPGDETVLTLTERPIPKPGPGEVLIEVTAAGVNRGDILQRKGLYPAPPGASDIPGLEVAGRIVAVGSGVSEPTPGAVVCALVTGGGYAEYCLAPARLCLPVPSNLTLIQAAGLPEALFTVWANVFELGRLRSGETLLVQGGTSGIGITAIQLARMIGARVLATAGSPEKCGACEKLGAEAIPYREVDFAERVKSLTQGDGVNMILDIIGGPYLSRHLAILAPQGRLVLIAVQGGAKTEINLAPLLLKRLTIMGSTLRSRPLEEKSRLARAIRSRIWPRIESGEFRPVIDSTFPLSEAWRAHAHMQSCRHIGKLILTTDHCRC
jgi:putative PIG3 family NAD(P)H quinone oxidoreductase